MLFRQIKKEQGPVTLRLEFRVAAPQAEPFLLKDLIEASVVCAYLLQLSGEAAVRVVAEHHLVAEDRRIPTHQITVSISHEPLINFRVGADKHVWRSQFFLYQVCRKQGTLGLALVFVPGRATKRRPDVHLHEISQRAGIKD